MSVEDGESGDADKEDVPQKSDLLGEAMRQAFEDRLADPLPPKIVELIDRLREKESHQDQTGQGQSRQGQSGQSQTGISSADQSRSPAAPPPSDDEQT